jgi:hypothetical protein
LGETVSQQWVAVVVALLTGGAVTAVVNYFLSRDQREIEVEVRQQEAAVAGLGMLVDQLQEERTVYREEVRQLRQEVELLKLRLRAIEHGE